MSWKAFAVLALPVVKRLTGFAEEAIPEPKSGPRRMEMVLGGLVAMARTLLGSDPPRDLLRGLVEATLADSQEPSRITIRCSYCCPKKEAVRAETNS